MTLYNSIRKTFVPLLLMIAGTMSYAQQDQDKPTVYMVGNAHFDTQWNWTVHTSIDEYVYNTLVQNFALMEEYPDYIFNFEGAVKYRWAKEYYPDLFARLKEYVKQGRWHISGASWDANDPNIPSIESNIRNILLGQEFYRDEFGVLSTDIMLPDCFGFGWQLPSVAAHCGLIGFGTQKLAWRMKPFFDNGMKFPFYFGIWQGPDGGKVMAAMDGGGYTWSPDKPVYEYPDIPRRLAGTTVPAAYRYFGTGDRGGSATPTGVRNINAAVHNQDGPFYAKFATTDDMFKDFLWDKRLPVYDGELLMDVHATGNYTSKVEMKMLNRRNERTLGAAEGISVMADWFKGLDYPAYTIDEGWKRILWHQFHDDLTGTSLPECYRVSYNDEYINLSQMNGVISTGMESVASIMDTRSKGTPVVVYNSVTADNGDIASIETVLPDGYKSFDVYGPNGRRVKSQIVSRDGDRAKVIFAGKSPSMGLSVYDFRASRSEGGRSTALKAGGNTIENRIYRITVNADGDISSIVDKRYGRELVRKGGSFGYAFFSGNVSEKWPAWEIMKEVMDRTPDKVNDGVKVSVEELGALRAVLKVERRHAGSTFTQRIVLTDGAEDERIDVVNTVDWSSRASLLKASFDFAFDAPEATYDLGMCHIRRGNNTDTAYEVIAQQWADMTAADCSYGVTIMNDGKYGWDKPDDHTLRLTLIHTPDSKRDFNSQTTQDFGTHTFTYSIVGHKGALDAAVADIAADKLNQPKFAQETAAHDGSLGKSFSMLSSTNRNLRVKAFKKAQDGDGYVVRVYELSGKGAEGSIKFASDVIAAKELNGIEDAKGPASVSGRSLNVNSSKFALRTFRVRLGEPSAKISRPEFVKTALPYNKVAITTDDFTTQGSLGKERESFAAEILPEELVYRGIPFSFGEANYNDAVFCDGQTINLPEGAKAVHILAAAAREENVTATFKLGGKEFSSSISNYTGLYGVYGWPGIYESVRRSDDVAYVGTHTHNPHCRNRAYGLSYMYLVSLPVNGEGSIVLPSGNNVVVFAMTVEK